MPLSPMLASSLRNWGHDAVHAAELGLARASDIDIVTLAKEEGRTIITADLDYPRLLAVAGATNPSLILFREGNWSDTEVELTKNPRHLALAVRRGPAAEHHRGGT
jgi:predicted nuclease of predicted toxin-antitoxin system